MTIGDKTEILSFKMVRELRRWAWVATQVEVDGDKETGFFTATRKDARVCPGSPVILVWLMPSIAVADFASRSGFRFWSYLTRIGSLNPVCSGHMDQPAQLRLLPAGVAACGRRVSPAL